jgi:hypothetical protein
MRSNFHGQFIALINILKEDCPFSVVVIGPIFSRPPSANTAKIATSLFFLILLRVCTIAFLRTAKKFGTFLLIRFRSAYYYIRHFRYTLLWFWAHLISRSLYIWRTEEDPSILILFSRFFSFLEKVLSNLLIKRSYQCNKKSWRQILKEQTDRQGDL